MKKKGEFVQRSQNIGGVEFSFQPPPRQITQRQRQQQLEQVPNAQTNLASQNLTGDVARATLQQALAQQNALMQQQINLLNQQIGNFHHEQFEVQQRQQQQQQPQKQ